jgi:hypothetical protein
MQSITAVALFLEIPFLGRMNVYFIIITTPVSIGLILGVPSHFSYAVNVRMSNGSRASSRSAVVYHGAMTLYKIQPILEPRSGAFDSSCDITRWFLYR